jgi:hypothetical protein
MSRATAQHYLTHLHDLGRSRSDSAAAPAAGQNTATGGPQSASNTRSGPGGGDGWLGLGYSPGRAMPVRVLADLCALVGHVTGGGETGQSAPRAIACPARNLTEASGAHLAKKPGAGG